MLTYNLFQINPVQNVNFIAKKILVLKWLSNMTTFLENKLATQVPEGKNVKSLSQLAGLPWQVAAGNVTALNQGTR